jgi:hypothetical protein
MKFNISFLAGRSRKSSLGKIVRTTHPASRNSPAYGLSSSMTNCWSIVDVTGSPPTLRARESLSDLDNMKARIDLVGDIEAVRKLSQFLKEPSERQS